MQAWNTSRVGSRLEQHLESLISEMDLVEKRHHQPFYWTSNSNTQLSHYRSNDVEKRNIEDIAPEEILVALQDLVNNNLSIDENELIRCCARSFGFLKVGKQIDSIIRYVINMAEERALLQRENGRIKVLGN